MWLKVVMAKESSRGQVNGEVTDVNRSHIMSGIQQGHKTHPQAGVNTLCKCHLKV